MAGRNQANKANQVEQAQYEWEKIDYFVFCSVIAIVLVFLFMIYLLAYFKYNFNYNSF